MGGADEPEVPVVGAEGPRVEGERRGDEAAAQVEDERDEADREEPGGHPGRVRSGRDRYGASAARVIRLGAASRLYHSASRNASSMRSRG